MDDCCGKSKGGVMRERKPSFVNILCIGKRLWRGCKKYTEPNLFRVTFVHLPTIPCCRPIHGEGLRIEKRLYAGRAD